MDFQPRLPRGEKPCREVGDDRLHAQGEQPRGLVLGIDGEGTHGETPGPAFPHEPLVAGCGGGVQPLHPEPLRLEPVDDMLLARLIKRSGRSVGLRLAPELLRCRMYRSNRAAFWAVEKNVLDAVEGKPWAPVVMLPPLVVLISAGWFTALMGLLTAQPVLIAAGLGLHFYLWATFQIARDAFRFDPLRLVLFPLGGISLTACIAKALYYRITRGAIVWRGRTIRITDADTK